MKGWVEGEMGAIVRNRDPGLFLRLTNIDSNLFDPWSALQPPDWHPPLSLGLREHRKGVIDNRQRSKVLL